jgi:hypothetical protein
LPFVIHPRIDQDTDFTRSSRHEEREGSGTHLYAGVLETNNEEPAGERIGQAAPNGLEPVTGLTDQGPEPAQFEERPVLVTGYVTDFVAPVQDRGRL